MINTSDMPNDYLDQLLGKQSIKTWLGQLQKATEKSKSQKKESTMNISTVRKRGRPSIGAKHTRSGKNVNYLNIIWTVNPDSRTWTTLTRKANPTNPTID